ncbi:MAG: YwqG family protein [Gaiella sp.]
MGVETTFRERLAAAGLGDYAAALETLTRSSIRLQSELVDEPSIGIGESKLGGHPDLPSAVEWPRYADLPQSFIAQINLAEVHRYDVDRLLPASGLLSFFYDSAQSVWGFDPREDGAWAVHYVPEGEDLIRRGPPSDLPEEGAFRAMRLNPSVELTYAPWEFSEVGALNLTRDEQFAYADLFEGGGETIHRLLGHPDPIQGDMQLECQLVSHGLYCGNSTGYNDPRAAELEPGAVDWRLLLQVDSEDDAGMMWGDVGRIYYWIHREALAARDWHQARLVLQCS